jgi:hypothetical protein
MQVKFVVRENSPQPGLQIAVVEEFRATNQTKSFRELAKSKESEAKDRNVHLTLGVSTMQAIQGTK